MTQLFRGPSPPPTPDVKPPAPMPDSNSAAVMEARRKAQLDVLNRAGRQSTILTAPKDRPGGDSYLATKLGSGG